MLIKNIKQLVQVEHSPRPCVKGADMAKIETIDNAFLLIKDEKIADFGTMENCPEYSGEVLDASNRLVFPTFCDSHTHIVYAGSRELEYINKIKGLSYEEIAKQGGGILNSAKRLNDASEEELIKSALARINEMISYGTGAIEIKSGYGLSTENELKMLRVIRRLKDLTPVSIKSNFLGAHAVAPEYRGRQSEYVDLVVNEMLPKVAEEKLADFVDVFCDKGFFTVEETDKILNAAAKYGLRPKIHANELDFSGGIQVGVKYNALSVDHLEYVGDAEIECLLNSETMPTVLPGAAFFLNLPLSPVRKMMEAGLPVALASDFNPGSSPSGNMQFIQSLGCIKYRMLPEEVIHATTLNTAYAMDLNEQLGSIAKGKIANVFITKPIPNYEFMPYSYGNNKVETVILRGKMIK
ncbi:MAG: imidazolonepropionase [Bacteroidales bacterium]|jgi:imidazolonepropionase|nr:imidazolonepropionase [Bacteroidales bacterium]